MPRERQNRRASRLWNNTAAQREEVGTTPRWVGPYLVWPRTHIGHSTESHTHSRVATAIPRRVGFVRRLATIFQTLDNTTIYGGSLIHRSRKVCVERTCAVRQSQDTSAATGEPQRVPRAHMLFDDPANDPDQTPANNKRQTEQQRVFQ